MTFASARTHSRRLPGDTGMDSIPVAMAPISISDDLPERGDAQDHDDRTSLTCKNPIDLQLFTLT